MLTGTAFALAAGLMWGLVFIGPVLLPEYPALILSLGRYLAFGLIALPLAWFDRKELRQLNRQDWKEALQLAAVGNLLYYICLASAIQQIGVPLPSMLIGTLPILIPIAANWLYRHRDGHLPWKKLLPALLLIGLGIACVNHTEIAHTTTANAASGDARFGSGVLMAVGAVLCWTWYPLRNAQWLRAHPDRQPRAWATAQGLATLPLAAMGYVAYATWVHLQTRFTPAAAPHVFEMPLGPRPEAFVGLMLAIGLFASWLGTLCWNEASQRLPTALAGQLIVFETLAALAYGYSLRGQWPSVLALTGIGLLVLGVLWGTRIQPQGGNVLADESKNQSKTQ